MMVSPEEQCIRCGSGDIIHTTADESAYCKACGLMQQKPMTEERWKYISRNIDQPAWKGTIYKELVFEIFRLRRELWDLSKSS